MTNNKKVVIKKINQLNLTEIEKRIAKSLYYQHLQDRKLELEKD